MDYDGRIFRPPNEADSILLQVTVGCPHPSCSFCAMYSAKQFRVKDQEEIRRNIKEAAATFPNKRRMFLCDGDSLSLSQRRLTSILSDVRQLHPGVKRISTYGNAVSVAKKSDEELRELRQSGLRLVHMGLESGDDATLARAGKPPSAVACEQGQRLRQAGIQVFVSVLVGLAGRERSEQHAIATGMALTRLKPNYVGALTVMLIPGTKLHGEAMAGSFQLPSPQEMQRELRTMIANTELDDAIFFANHSSNYAPLMASLPEDKQEVLDLLDRAAGGRVPLRPEASRGF